MLKAVVFDLGGTLMEYVGMPLNWSGYYAQGFQRVKDFFVLPLSGADLEESVRVLQAYNPRASKRDYEVEPEKIFSDAVRHWPEKPPVSQVIGVFFEGLELKATLYGYAVELLRECRGRGLKTACLTDLPNGMPDYLFRPAVEGLLPYLDLYVSSQVCGRRKPHKAGIDYIASAWAITPAEILFVGDEEKDLLTARNAGCGFAYIRDFLRERGNPPARPL